MADIDPSAMELMSEVVAQVQLEGDPPYGAAQWSKLADDAELLVVRYTGLALAANRISEQARRMAADYDPDGL